MKLYSWFNKSPHYFQNDESIQSNFKKQQGSSAIKNVQAQQVHKVTSSPINPSLYLQTQREIQR